MIKEEDGSVTAHTWSSAAQQWINVNTSKETSSSNILTDKRLVLWSTQLRVAVAR
jgi:hypothetical protein